MPSTARIIADRPVAKSLWVGTVYGRALIVIIVTADKQAVGEGEKCFCQFCPISLPARDHINQPANLNWPKESLLAGYICMRSRFGCSIDRHFALKSPHGCRWPSAVPNYEIMIPEVSEVRNNSFLTPTHSELCKQQRVFFIPQKLFWFFVCRDHTEHRGSELWVTRGGKNCTCLMECCGTYVRRLPRPSVFLTFL